jgi:TorA maturation chaperone TorD
MDNIKQWLVERKTIYFILALLYDGKIDEALEIIRENDLLQHFADYIDNTLISVGSNKVIKEIDENQANDDYRALILDDYQRLFVGPNEILAPLWESVYKTKDKLLFGEIELEVRRFYNSVGLDVKESEPSDYLPLQLSFMSRLCDTDDNNLGNINKNLIKQRDFLKEHLLLWISSWVEDVEKNAEIRFWAGFAQITRGWLENDLDEIEKVIRIYYN